jgi:diadenosine tetraphosphate (Ap4A) HIT family hydrolase
MNLHPQLKQDCHVIGQFPLSILLLHKDANYPWFILVPDRLDMTEIFQLNENDQQQLMKESCILADALSRKFNADKLNIAAIGNLVPQLHLHHIVRYRDDIAWPSPIWGLHPPLSYSPEQLAMRIELIRTADMADLTLT